MSNMKTKGDKNMSKSNMFICQLPTEEQARIRAKLESLDLEDIDDIMCNRYWVVEELMED